MPKHRRNRPPRILALVWVMSMLMAGSLVVSVGGGTARAEEPSPEASESAPEASEQPSEEPTEEPPPTEQCSGLGSAGPLPEGSQSISGTITDGLQPLEGIKVLLGLAGMGRAATTQTNPLGEFQFEGLGDGTYTVAFHDDNGPYVSGFWNSTTPPAIDPASATEIELTGSGQGGVDATLQTDTLGSISGAVSDHLLQPVPGAQVRGDGAHLPVLGCADASSGSFTMADLASGIYILTVNAPGFPQGYYAAGAPGEFTTHRADATLVTVDGDISGLIIDFPQLYELTGVVLDDDGNPVTGVSISASEIVEGASGFGSPCCEDGSFAIGGLPAGEYHVRYEDGVHQSGWYAGNGMFSATEDGAATVTVPGPAIELLATAAPVFSGVITNEDGFGVADASVNICSEFGDVCAFATTGIDGSYSASITQPETFYVQVFEGSNLYPYGAYVGSLGGFMVEDFEDALAIPAGSSDVLGVDGVLPDGGDVEVQLTSGGSHFDYPYVLFCRSKTICSNGPWTYDGEADAISPVLFEGTYYVFIDYDNDGTGHWLVDGGAASTAFDDATPVVVVAKTRTVVTSDVPPDGAETPLGDPQIDLQDGSGSTITMAFDNVDVAGITSVTTSDTGFPPPSGFQLGAPATYYDFTSTAEFDTVTICIPYGGASWISEANLRLFHYDDALPGWEDITILPVNTGDQIICGLTDSLSPFVLAERSMTFSGFFQPVDTLALNRAKAGAGVPVKFSLGGDFGLGVFAEGYPSVSQIACPGTTVDAIEQTVSVGTSHLLYDAAANQYVYLFKTAKSWAGTCRELTMVFTDGTTRTALFQFTK